MNLRELFYRDVAILVDYKLSNNYLFKSMFLNVPIRNVVMEIEAASEDLENQLNELTKLDITNVFIVGDQKTISLVLSTAQSPELSNQKHAWFAIILDELQPICYTCVNISLVTITPDVLFQVDEIHLIKNLVSSEIYLMSVFYFEITKFAVLAMKKALELDLWDPNVKQLYCHSNYNEEEAQNSMQNFDFLEVLQSVIESKKADTIFDDYVWEENEGWYPQFTMSIYLITFTNTSISSIITVGSWDNGFNSTLQVNA